MQMKIITTALAGKPFAVAILEHETAVNKFNREHNVFFNQGTDFKELGTTLAMIYSVILYAELRRQFVTLPLSIGKSQFNNIQPPKVNP
jgi:hypothetical protein